MSKNLIIDVIKNSISEELGIKKGDYLISINGNVISDCIEYRFLETSEYLEVEIEDDKGDICIYEIEKEMDESLGIIYENPLMDEVKTCSNKCIFCFIDQLPKNMRKSMYLKDDDSRLSFLTGNFLTLTNMKDDEINKIIQYGISPIKISIHTTNPELRVKMLKNKNAANILNILDKFKNTNIQVDCQIVLVPDYNDKNELQKTIEDLISYYPVVRSVAIVPVGITKYRSGLENIRALTDEECIFNIDIIKKYQEKFINLIDTRFVFLSDEFFIKGKCPIPDYSEYEDFNLLENGVGMIALFEYELLKELKKINKLNIYKNYSIITGALAYEFMKKISFEITNTINNISIEVYKIENDFFGRDVNVSGLVTAQDIIAQTRGKLKGTVLIPKNMLKSDEDIFLDDYTLIDLEKELNLKVKAIETTGYDLIREIMESVKNG
jgi:putative radical SAM enzyme (TIGR03279 family)